MILEICSTFDYFLVAILGHAVAYLVEPQRYKLEGCRFDS
jgi:hypothetical protein